MDTDYSSFNLVQGAVRTADEMGQLLGMLAQLASELRRGRSYYDALLAERDVSFSEGCIHIYIYIYITSSLFTTYVCRGAVCTGRCIQEDLRDCISE